MIFTRLEYLGNLAKGPLNAKYTKNIHFWTIFGSKLGKMIRNEHFRPNMDFISTFSKLL